MQWYINLVKHHLLLSSFIQFAILGTLGEFIAFYIFGKDKSKPPFTFIETLGKMFAWGILGIIIKYAFTGYVGGISAIVDKGLLPRYFASAKDGGISIFNAFAVSVSTNLTFGPVMMYFHRWEDNIVLRKNSYAGMSVALWTLVWFWIPAHTITFILPVHFRIGLAALWGTVLGVILGAAKNKN